MLSKITFISKSLVFIFLFTFIAESREFDLTKYHDANIALDNPHKGWYHHFPDNHINKYQIKNDSHILNFSGMDHIYIRLSWAYLEPREGQFNWTIIDDIINKWKKHNIGFAFRISCKETSTDRIEQQFATPKWVMEAGAKGGYYRNGETVDKNGPWEPDFNDPIYLEKLDNFLAAFAKRYDGNSGLRYVDVGSIGDWGEGHTHSGSRKRYGFEARKKHIDLYMKHFKQSLVVVTDDFVYSVPDESDRKRLHQYVIAKGLSYRDDSILVDWYLTVNSETYTVRSPQYFESVYKTKPTVLELEHYGTVKKSGNWIPTSGSSLEKYGEGKLGADYFRGALELMHATYIGYHGYADEWLSDNSELTIELLNKCGYWYFIHKVETPDAFQKGKKNELKIEWENKGVAPAYHSYKLHVRFEGETSIDITQDSGNQNWMPGEISRNVYQWNSFMIPSSVPAGEYTLKLKLYSPDAKEDVKIAMDAKRQDADGFYTIGAVNISN